MSAASPCHATQKTGRNALFEFCHIKKKFVPAFSKFRGRQLKRKQLELDAFKHEPAVITPLSEGNYVGGRIRIPRIVIVQSPAERFAKLKAAYECHYKSKPEPAAA